MNRREFIQAFTQTSLVGVVALTPSKLLLKKVPVQIKFKGKLLKGTEDGQILASSDAGLNWNNVTDFGADYQVRELYQSRQFAFATMVYEGHQFTLQSADGAKWLV